MTRHTLASRRARARALARALGIPCVSAREADAFIRAVVARADLVCGAPDRWLSLAHARTEALAGGAYVPDILAMERGRERRKGVRA